MVDLINIVICFFFLAIPEMVFMVVLLIKFMGRRELLDVYRLRENIKWYVILVIPPSLIMSLLVYGFKVQQNVASLINLTILYLLSIYVFEKTNIDEVKYLKIKIFMRFIPLYICLIIIDLSTAPVWFFFLHLSFQEISKNIYLVLICSLSSRIIEFTVIIFILTYNKKNFKTNLLEYIYKNTFFRRFTIITMISLLLFEICILLLVAYNDLLNILNSLTGQILFILGFTYLIPFLVIIGVYLNITHYVSFINSVRQDSLPLYKDDEYLFNK